MAFHARPFHDEGDLAALLALTQAAATEGAGHVYYLPGDVVWQMFQWPATIFDPAEHIFLWEDDEAADEPLAGFTWADSPGEMAFQLHPRMRASGQGAALLDAMLAWGEQRASAAGVIRREVPALANDTLYDDALTRHGFSREATPGSIIFQQRLDMPIPAPLVPDGWRVRHVSDEADFARRVELHRAVWNPSRVTVEAYRRLRAAPLYRPELDLVVVSPEGEFGAYCICWLDEVNQAGEFEPVGTHPQFRGLRLGKVVIQEGLRRLQAYGARLASVIPGARDHPPKFNAAIAHRLYSGAGFAVVNTIYGWRASVA